MRKLIALIVSLGMVFSSASVFAADTLMDAFAKSSEIESCDMSGSVKLSVDIQTDEETAEMVPEWLLDILKGITIDYTATQFTSDSNRKATLYLDMDISAGDYQIALNEWLDMDFTDMDNPTMKIVVEIPDMLNALTGINKKYLVMDYSKIWGGDNGPLLSFRNAFVSNSRSILNLRDMFISVIDTLEWQDAGNGMYTLTLDDTQAKEVIINMLGICINNEFMQTVLPEGELDEINMKLLDLFEALRAITLFSDEGVVIDAKVNDDGYVDYQRVKYNISVDVKDSAEKIMKAFSEEEGLSPDFTSEMPEMTIGMVIDAEAQLDNINSADEEKIVFPELTDDNSLDVFSNLLTMGGDGPEVTFDEELEEDVVVHIDGVPLEFEDALPVVIDDRTLVPARAIFEALGGQMEYAEVDGAEIITGTLGDNEVRLVIGEKIAFVNGEEIELDVPAMINEYNRTMVPLRFVAENLGLLVDYSTYANVLHVYIFTQE